MAAFRPSNIPVPEAHLVLLVFGLALHAWRPLPLIDIPWLMHLFGWPLLLLGFLLAAWAVVTIRDMDISKPIRVVDSGPYRFSRNPMYVAWTAIYLGVALIANSGWLVIFLPVLIVYTHYWVILREERQLEQQFGDDYRMYRDRVPRYLALRPSIPDHKNVD